MIDPAPGVAHSRGHPNTQALRVRRIYDAKNKVLLYVAYSTRFTSSADEGGASSSRYRTSVCAVPLAPPTPQLLPAAAQALAE